MSEILIAISLVLIALGLMDIARCCCVISGACCEIAPATLYGRICITDCDCATQIDFTLNEDLTPDISFREWDAVPDITIGTCETTLQLTLTCVSAELHDWSLYTDGCLGGEPASFTTDLVSCYFCDPTELHFEPAVDAVLSCCPAMTKMTVHIFATAAARDAWVCGDDVCNCPACVGFQVPNLMQVVLSDIGNDSCEACTNLNGTHALEFFGSFQELGIVTGLMSTVCIWRKTGLSIGAGATCDDVTIDLRAEKTNASGDVNLYVNIYDTGAPTRAALFSKTYGIDNPVPCSTLAGETLRWVFGAETCATTTVDPLGDALAKVTTL